MGSPLSWSWRWISSWWQWGSKHQNRNQLWSSSIILGWHSRILLKLRRYAAWSPLGLAGFTTGEVSLSRLVGAQSEESLLSSLFCIITLLSDLTILVKLYPFIVGIATIWQKWSAGTYQLVLILNLIIINWEPVQLRNNSQTGCEWSKRYIHLKQ